jgi:hypothetical protein
MPNKTPAKRASDRTADAGEAKKAPKPDPIRPLKRKISEGGDENLRRREEWFQKQRGGG